MRTSLPLVALTLAAAAVLSDGAPVAANGDTVHLDLAGQQNGRVTAVATWESDHDPVTGDFAGTLSATAADGRTVGPWRLVAVPGSPGTYTTREILPAGHWRVTVECAFPAPGHGERELDVEAAATGERAPLAPGPDAAPPSVSAAATSAAHVHETTDGATTWAAVGTAAVAVVLVATGLWLRRRPQH